MVCLVVAAHGHLAEGLVASSAMIVGPSDDVVAVTFEPSEGPDDLLAKYAAAVEAKGYDVVTHSADKTEDFLISEAANLLRALKV